MARHAPIHVGILVAHSPAGDPEQLQTLALALADEVRPTLEQGTGGPWVFHLEEPIQLGSDTALAASDFLDDASMIMSEGPYDVVVVLTNVGLVSRRQRLVSGLSSPVGRVAVVSLRKLRTSPRGEQLRDLRSSAVRLNAAALLLHLFGHMLGLHHGPGGVMAPFRFAEGREALPGFSERERARLARRAADFPEATYRGDSPAGRTLFHLKALARHPRLMLMPLMRNRAPLLPMSLPSLATAAITPTFILVFTAEIWDVGVNLPPGVTWYSAAAVIVIATWYLAFNLGLFFPHKDRDVLTEHTAVVNGSIFLTVLIALAGLFVLVGLVMAVIVFWVFPPGLIRTWPTLEDPYVDLWDKIRLIAFISTLGVITGTLAGGLESRNLIRHFALFLDEP